MAAINIITSVHSGVIVLVAVLVTGTEGGNQTRLVQKQMRFILTLPVADAVVELVDSFIPKSKY